MTKGTTDKSFFDSILHSVKECSIVLAMVTLVVFLGNGLNLVGWGFIVQIRYYLLLAACSWVIGAYCFLKLRKEHILFKYYSLFLCLWPFVPVIVSVLGNGDIGAELRAIPTWVFVANFFFVFHYCRFTEKRVLCILLIVALVTVAIQIAQQFDPLFAVFGGSPDDTSEIIVPTDQRNGLARYFVGCYQVQMFVLCFVWSKMLQTFRGRWMLLSVLMLVSIYLYLTRQILLSTLMTIALSFLWVKGRTVRILAAILLCLCIVLLAIFWEDLFGDMIKESMDDTWSQAIRFEFIGFLMEYNLTDPLGVLLGHGYSYPLLEDWLLLQYHPSDIGFFGESIYFGWLWALSYLYVAFRILVTYRNRIPIYLRLYVVCSGLISFFIFPYRNRIELYNWVSVIYLVSLYVGKSNVVMNKTKDMELKVNSA